MFGMRGDGLRIRLLRGMRLGITAALGSMIFAIARNVALRSRVVSSTRRSYGVSSSSQVRWSSVFSGWSSQVRSSWSRWALSAAWYAYRLSDVKCARPFRAGLIEGGCGQCLPCRINRQRLWTIRCLLEAGQHQHSSYVTLTYDDKHLPLSGSVSLRDIQLFFKRLRRRGHEFRYYACAEYGERSWRPHYHAILFGLRDGCGVREAWRDGFVHISGVGPESIAYVAGYCLKGAYNERGMKWHGKNLVPEFNLMSLRPAIGATAAERIGSFLSSKDGSRVIARDRAVPSVVRYSTKMWPLGRYLKGKISEAAGLDELAIRMHGAFSRVLELSGMSQASLNQYIDVADGRAQRAHGLAKIRYQVLQQRRPL